MRKGNKVYIDTDVENQFLVTNKKSGKVTKFPCNKCGLYVRESDSVTRIDCCVHNFNSTHVEGYAPL